MYIGAAVWNGTNIIFLCAIFYHVGLPASDNGPEVLR